MKKSILFYLLILFFACNNSSDNEATKETSNSKSDSINMKSLFELSPLTIFDATTEGLDASGKSDLLKKGESDSWKIIDESETKLIVKSKQPSSEVTLYFLKNKENSDGLLFAQVVNEKNNNIHSWKYSNESQSLQKANVLKEYNANDFVSEEDKLPNSYKPILNYLFIDDQTIEVSLNTWMEEEFENREIIHKIFLKWNGETFEEKIVGNDQLQESNNYQPLEKPTYDYLSNLDYEGKIVNERFWKDSNGENIVLFTRKENEIFTYHYTVNSGKGMLLKKLSDSEKDCDYDLTLEFVENSINLSDLDNNNIGEITFAYKKACISDVSPKDLKLVLLENGKIYSLSGSTIVNMGDEKIGGDKNIDPSFNDAPDNFLSHANKIWKSINE